MDLSVWWTKSYHEEWNHPLISWKWLFFDWQITWSFGGGSDFHKLACVVSRHPIFCIHLKSIGSHRIETRHHYFRFIEILLSWYIIYVLWTKITSYTVNCIVTTTKVFRCSPSQDHCWLVKEADGKVLWCWWWLCSNEKPKCVILGLVLRKWNEITCAVHPFGIFGGPVVSRVTSTFGCSSIRRLAVRGTRTAQFITDHWFESSWWANWTKRLESVIIMK